MDRDNRESGDVQRSSEGRRQSVWRAGIISSLIASGIFVFVLQPLLSRFSGFTLAIIDFVWRGAADQWYEQAPLGVDDTLLWMLASIAMTPIIATSFIILFMRSRAVSKWMTNLVDAAIFSPSRKSEKGVATRNGLARWLTIIWAVIGLIAALFVVFGNFVTVQAAASYRLRAMILAPVTTQREKDELMAEWANVRSRSDYDKVMSAMDRLAAKSGTKLPTPLI